MSTVSVPSPPSMVMVLKFRLVPREVADHLDGVPSAGAPCRAAGRRDVERVDADFLDVVEFGDHDPVAGDDDLGADCENQARDRRERGGTGVDREGLGPAEPLRT